MSSYNLTRREDQVAEIIKCGKDFIYFSRNYAKIVSLTQGRILFETYPFQDEVMEAFEKYRFNIILKARQLGLTTAVAVYAVWLSIFYKDKNILVIATKLDTAMNFIKKCNVVLDGLPEWLLLPKFDRNKRSITFSNGSSITAISTSDDAGRTEAVSLLVVDEAAHIKNFEDIWTGLYPTLATGGRAIVISTPNGVGGQYYKIWTAAEAGVSEFNAIRLPWDVHPERDEEWFKLETRNFSPKKIAQEYECDFLASGDTFLQPNTLAYVKEQIRPPIQRLGSDQLVWCWATPIVDHRYVISADVARGDAHDYSAFHVIDMETSEVVAEYMGKIPPEKLADLLLEIGELYNTALLCPENNSFGYATCIKLRESGYKRLYYDKHRGDPFSYTPFDRDELPGFSTQTKIRQIILTQLEELLRTKKLHVHSQRLYEQLQSFVWIGAKPQASRDSYDDLVISLAIGGYLAGGSSLLNEQAVAMTYALANASKVERRDVTTLPFGTHKSYSVANPNQSIRPQDAYKPRDPGEIRHVDVSDFSWLLK